MPNYRRAWHPGGTYFFTLNLLQRSGYDLLVRHIDLLRDAMRMVRAAHPFTIHAWVVMQDHLLAGKGVYSADWAGGAEGDADYQE